MPTNLILPLSIVLAVVAWSLIMAWYVHPLLNRYPLERALEPILFLHTFRYVGLMFLLPGVTAEVLDSRFSYPAAYGDLVAAALAFVAIGAIRMKLRWALGSVWVFNIWGTADLLNAVARGILFTPDGHLGAAYWIPATIVPLLLVTHAYIFILLTRRLWTNRRLAAS
jgi:membrane-associated HD superfamily phosphohydrolase